MRLKLMFWLLLFLFIGFVAHSHADVEWSVQRKIEMDTQPVDIAISPDGKRIFVLNDKGEILVYSRRGKLEDRIALEKDFDQIKVAPRGNILYLKSRKSKAIEIVELDFVQNINITGSPFKGPADAPVVIAVFDDFQ